jgi:hypothetical protein
MLVSRAALFGVATKVAQGTAGLVTAVLILKYFTPVVQGYYYTFANLLALQIFLELGLSAVITTFAAHEWPNLSLDPEGIVRGDEHSLARLRSLTRKVVKWYLGGGVMLLFLLIFAGLWFFDGQGGAELVSWKYPWIAMCVLAALNFFITPTWALLTGCGQLASLNAFRMVETVVRYGTLWVCVAIGASLWSAVGALAISTAAGYAFLAMKYRGFFGSLFVQSGPAGISWFKELAPLQARIAISWISGYFAFSLFAPAMFHFHGAEEAGRMGMTWALVAGLSGIAGTWLQVQSPQFSMMVARKAYGELDTAARRTALIGLVVFGAGALVGIGGLYVLDSYRPDLAGRLVPIGPIALFMFAELLHQISMVQSTYLRAFKKEPFLGISVVSGLVIGLGTLLSVPSLGAYGPAVSYLTGVSIALVWGTLIFVRDRAKWTAPTPY